MGIIKAAIGAIGGALADTWLEAIQPADMGNNTAGSLRHQLTLKQGACSGSGASVL